MRKINIILLILSLAAIMYGCSEEQTVAQADPNVVNRGEVEYNITAELAAGDTNNQNFKFGINQGGTMLEDNETHYVKWDFGDTNEGEGLSPEHSYAAAGEYTVTAFITDNVTDKFRTASVTIVSGIDPDIYDTNILAYREEDRRAFRMVASAVSASGESLKYSWNFNDGTPITLAKKQNSVDHFFAKYGETYDVEVTIDNGKGGAGSKVQSSIKINTELPDLEYLCGSGGAVIDNLGALVGQALNCEPKLTGGSIPDAVYSWEYYSEIKKEQFELDNASMLVTKNGVEVEYNQAEADAGSYKYFALEGVGTSNVNNPTSFIYKDGGRKFIKVEGSSQNFLKTNMKYASELLLPSNAYLDLITCAIDTSSDTSGLTYKCTAKGYAMPKKEEDGTPYVTPLTAYNWSVLDHNGEIVAENAGSAETKCYTSDSDSGTDVSNMTPDQFVSAGYKYCTSTVTYKAKKYDVAPVYSTMVLDTVYYETIGTEQTEHLELRQTRDFRVEAPNIETVTPQQDAKNKLTFQFTAEFDRELNDITDVMYHWDFGDGTKYSNPNSSVSHTYQNADGTYNVTVYASSSLFERTGEGTTRVQMTPSFTVSTFTVVAADKGNNTFTFSSNYLAQVDGVTVPTEYEITISGGDFRKVYKVPGTYTSGLTITSQKPTVANLQDNNVLSVPFGMPFTATLKVINTKSNQLYYATTTIALSTLSKVNYVHPSWTTAGFHNIYVSELKSSTDVAVTDLNNFTCVYDAHYNGSNSNLRGKLGFSTNRNFDETQLKSSISVPCGTSVYVRRFDGQNNLVNVSARMTGPYYGIPVNRFLGIYPPNGSGN